MGSNSVEAVIIAQIGKFTALVTLHFHLIPQYKYELFHIYFTWFHCTGRNELNKLTLLPMCGFVAQLVEHRTGIAEVMGSNPVEAVIFFRLLLSSCSNWKIYCDDHTSLSRNVMLTVPKGAWVTCALTVGAWWSMLADSGLKKHVVLLYLVLCSF